MQQFIISSDQPLTENVVVQYSITDGGGNYLPQDIIFEEVELTSALVATGGNDQCDYIS